MSERAIMWLGGAISGRCAKKSRRGAISAESAREIHQSTGEKGRGAILAESAREIHQSTGEKGRGTISVESAGEIHQSTRTGRKSTKILQLTLGRVEAPKQTLEAPKLLAEAPKLLVYAPQKTSEALKDFAI